MKNNIRVTFFIASYFWIVGQCENIESNGVRESKNLNSEKQVRKVRSFTNGMSEESIGGIPISEIVSAYDGKLEELNYHLNIKNDGNGGLYERNGYKFKFDEGNPDIHGEIRRPCQAYDTFCIRKFFAEHSKCKISGRAVPDPLYRAEGNINFASNNMSLTQITADYNGLNNARVSEFYINKVTDNLVIAITFDSVSKFSNNTYLKYSLRGREPIVTRDFGGIRYGVLTVTVIIPHIDNLSLERSEIYAYGDTNIFPFALGPQVATSSDPEATSMYARFYANIPAEYQEEIFIQGNYFAANYIQYNICDFGVKVL